MCPVYDGKCVTMSSSIIYPGSNDGSLGIEGCICSLILVDCIGKGLLTGHLQTVWLATEFVSSDFSSNKECLQSTNLQTMWLCHWQQHRRQWKQQWLIKGCLGQDYQHCLEFCPRAAVTRPAFDHAKQALVLNINIKSGSLADPPMYQTRCLGDPLWLEGPTELAALLLVVKWD